LGPKKAHREVRGWRLLSTYEVASIATSWMRHARLSRAFL
jgi:hypothetical protein